MNLRPYQQAAHDAAIAELEKSQSTLIVLPTGCGKTVVFSHIVKHFVSKGRVLVLAHREELIRQAAAKIFNVTGEDPGIEMADERARSGLFQRDRIIVSSIQTQIAGRERKRMHTFKPEDFSLIITDEAHHAVADSYRKVYRHYLSNPNCKHLGVTATPDRTDERALGLVFGSVAYVYEILDAIDDGFLVPVTQKLVRITNLDFSGIHTVAGDLNQAELAQLMEDERMLQEVAKPTLDLAQWRRTLIFSPSVKHAERLAEIMNRSRPNCARWLCGETDRDRRRQLLADYAEGRFQFLVNVGVLTEGFDEPAIQMVVLARPTKSRALYAQMIGRGTRPLTGIIEGKDDPESRRTAIARSRKPNVLVLDFEGNSGHHKLITSADVLGGNYDDDVVARAKVIVAKENKEGKAMDAGAALKQAYRDREADREREAARRQKVHANVEFETEDASPFDPSVTQPRRERGWDMSIPPSDGQKKLLERMGIPIPKNRHEAGQIIGDIMRRRDQGKCTWKMAKTLKKYGYDGEQTFAEAKSLIDAIAANGWKRPAEQGATA